MIKSFTINFIIFNYIIMINIMMIILLMIPSKTKKIHPLSMIMILIFFTILISLKMNTLFKSWMNLILFMVMIGGLMIIFLYITSLANNENLTINFQALKLFFMKIYFMSLIFMIWMNIYPIFWVWPTPQDLTNYFNNNIEELHEFMISETYNLKKNSMLFIMIYLYYSLICIMNICYKLKSPLRQLYLFE